MCLAEWDYLKVTDLVSTVAIANDVVSVTGSRSKAYHARKLLDALQMFLGSFRAALWFLFF